MLFSNVLTRITGARLFVAGACAVLLAGCVSTGGSSGVSESEQRFTEKLLFAGNKLPEPAQENPQANLSCPEAAILEGTAAYRQGGDAARGVAYQAQITNVARECKPQGASMVIRVGVEGRFLLGEAGKPGSYSVPLRVAVRKGDQTVYSQLHRVGVTIPSDDSQTAFVFVDENVRVAIEGDDPASMYKVIVGVDPKGSVDRPASKKRRR
jgi:hypothetical protein